MIATLTTLVSFTSGSFGVGGGPNGAMPEGDLIADSNGDLFGTTSLGGAYGYDGTVFEIAKTVAGYASTPTTLVSFEDGGTPVAGLLADAHGDLFGTTEKGGTGGTVFEIAKSPTGYASAPTTLASFNGADGSFPAGSLIADANGDLFGTTSGGGAFEDNGTVFEIVKTPTGYASTPTTLVSFDNLNGSAPVASLIADSNGDLFGTTELGGPIFFGTVFEIAKTPTGYASTPTTLVSFDPRDDQGQNPKGSLIADANGDLFGTTSFGGGAGHNDGTVFEIRKTAAGYASAPVTLASFNGADGGQMPTGGLIADANGDLFGTTSGIGVSNVGNGTNGTVFEIKKTPAGYASTPITLVSFNGADGSSPDAALIADAAGDLFGTTAGGGANGAGTVFEITGSGFATTRTITGPPAASDFNGDGLSDILWQNTSGQAAVWEMDGTSQIAGGSALVGGNPGPSWKEIGTGDFNGDGHSDILWQNTSGQAAVWELNGATVSAAALIGGNPGPSWKEIGTGDFNGDGHSDILWQNASGQAAIWEMNGTNRVAGGSQPVGANPGPSWKEIGTGDFNGDGKSDILWQNANGQAAIWEMNGTNVIGSALVGANPGPSWKEVGTGDFNGDGKSDILWQNANGQAAIWEMNGTNVIGSASVGANPGPSWELIGARDVNGDGLSDLLWQNINGQAAVWEMSGTSVIGSALVGANPGSSWHAIKA